MNNSLTAPIVQFEFETDTGPQSGPPVAPIIQLSMMRALREAYRTGEAWSNGGRIVVLIEDPFGVLPAMPGGAK